MISHVMSKVSIDYGYALTTVILWFITDLKWLASIQI